MSRLKDLTGLIFGRLTVLNRTPNTFKRPKWDCLCQCGNIKSIDGSSLKFKQTLSCGCLRKETIKKIATGSKHHRKNIGEASFNSIYRYYQFNAKRRGHQFALTPEQLKDIITKNCFYCGIEPLQIMKTSDKTVSVEWKEISKFVHNGIDRVDNNIGYLIGNVVPCCGICNRLKYTLTVDLFFNKVKRIYERHKLNDKVI